VPDDELTDAAEDHHNPDRQVHNPAIGTQSSISNTFRQKGQRVCATDTGGARQGAERKAARTKHLRNPWQSEYLLEKGAVAGIGLDVYARTVHFVLRDGGIVLQGFGTAQGRKVLFGQEAVEFRD
jgi:hypothetical protein